MFFRNCSQLQKLIEDVRNELDHAQFHLESVAGHLDNGALGLHANKLQVDSLVLLIVFIARLYHLQCCVNNFLLNA